MKITQNLAVLVLLTALTACSSLQKTDDVSTQRSADPLQGMNRQIYAFNDAADRAILKPIATAYQNTLPQPARNGIGNFFDNLSEPLNVVNNLLQGKFDHALHSTYRFTVNSTIGLFGFFDVADKYGVDEKREDFGQTFAAWGMKPGPYIVLPFFGPSNLRDSIGLLTGGALYYPNDAITESTRASLALTALGVIDLRAGLLGADKVLQQQPDPYLFLKSAYETERINSIYDDNPPAPPEEDFDF